MNIDHLLKRQEGKTLEFKRDLSSSDHVLRTIVAFANCSGGILLIGVEDGTRNVRGVADPLDVQERLANIVTTGISPPLMPAIEVLPWRDTGIIAVEVFQSYLRPHCLLKEGPDSGVYIRVGASNRKADEQMRAELKRTARNISYDELPIPELSSEAIDFRAASELFTPVRKLTKTGLETLHMLVRHQQRLVPTNGGVILFGTEREQFFPDAWIHVGRFGGTTRASILDSREVHDLPPLAIEKATEFVQKHALLSFRIEGLRREERWSIPLAAVREAIVNAVAHADYSQRGAPIRVLIFDDRLEVESPGLLPFGLTVEDIRQGVSRLRNRVIGRVLKELGFIEQWGSGIRRMIEVCHDSGFAAPEFEEIGTHFRVTIRLTPQGPATLDTMDHRILEVLQAADGMSTKEIAHAVELSTRSARAHLKELVARQIVVEVGSSPTDPKRRYFAAAGTTR